MARDDIGGSGSGGAGQAAQAVADRGKDLSASAGDHVRQVTDTVAGQVEQAKQELVQEGRNLLEDTRRQLQDQAEGQTQRLAKQMTGMASQLRALAEGQPEQAGQLPSYARQAASRLETAGQRIQRDGAQGLLYDVQDLARRRPVAFLAGAALLGMAAGRFARASKDASSGSGSGSTPVGQHSIGAASGPVPDAWGTPLAPSAAPLPPPPGVGAAWPAAGTDPVVAPYAAPAGGAAQEELGTW